MRYFVDQNSIVRKIWGNGDVILLIFAGAAAEFALNKAVDWLYFTGKLPKDPLGRLFSTVSYARRIVFSEEYSALKSIDEISSIHSAVENKRGKSIPNWAYRDVLFMLIDYSIRSYEILQKPLTYSEKVEVFQVFNRVGNRMGIKDLPETYNQWTFLRLQHIENNLEYSASTKDLFFQYKLHLGSLRYLLLTETQKLIVPKKVSTLLRFKRSLYLRPIISLYKISHYFKLNKLLKSIILPKKYKREIFDLDFV